MDGRPQNNRGSPSRRGADHQDSNDDNDQSNEQQQQASSTTQQRSRPLRYDDLFGDFGSRSTTGSTRQPRAGHPSQRSESTGPVRQRHDTRSHPYQRPSHSSSSREPNVRPNADSTPGPSSSTQRTTQPYGIPSRPSASTSTAPARTHPSRVESQGASSQPPVCAPTHITTNTGFFDHSQLPHRQRSRTSSHDSGCIPRVPINYLLPALPADAEQRLRNLWRDRRSGRQVLIVQGITITAAEMGSLYEGQLLFDSVINAYLALVLKRLTDEGNLNVSMAPAGISLLCENGLTPLSPADILSVGLVGNLFGGDVAYVPYNCRNRSHWTLFVVDFVKKTIKTYDPPNGDRRQSMENFFQLLHYLYEPLVNAGQATPRGPLRRSEWRLETAQDIPRQTNHTDCGIFICQYVNYLCGFAETDEAILNSCIQEADMMYFRQRMALQLVNQRVEMP